MIRLTLCTLVLAFSLATRAELIQLSSLPLAIQRAAILIFRLGKQAAMD